MAPEGVETLPALGAPQLARLVEGAGGDLVPADRHRGCGLAEARATSSGRNGKQQQVTHRGC